MPPSYKVNKTGNEFLLRTGNMTWSNAQKECNKWGGHLASYINRDEQIEVGSGCPESQSGWGGSCTCNVGCLSVRLPAVHPLAWQRLRRSWLSAGAQVLRHIRFAAVAPGREVLHRQWLLVPQVPHLLLDGPDHSHCRASGELLLLSISRRRRHLAW